MHNMQLIWQQNKNAFWLSHAHSLNQVLPDLYVKQS